MRELRRRLTAAAAAILLVVLAGTSVALVVAQRRVLTESVDDGVRRRAADLVVLVRSGDLPSTLGTSEDDDAVQVVGPDGTVLAASPNLAGEDPVAPARDALRTLDVPAIDDDPVRLLTRRLEDGTVVHVAASVDDVDEVVGLLSRSLAVAVPVVTGLLSLGVWWLVGRTLRPVVAAARRQERFVADAAHELRSPLTRMRTELEVDAAHPASADPRATHASVLEEVVGLQHLVDDLLHLARSDAGAAGPRLDRVDLGAVARHHAPDATVVGDVVVPGDADGLDRVVANLVDNARRHAATTVAVEVRRRDGSVVLAVADDGPGIPAAERERVFERFARLDDSRTPGDGRTGLGLAIARDVVERHGGTIAVDPGHHPGARLVVTLPA